MSNPRQFCTFYVDGHFYGVEVQTVQEVIRYQAMTRVPLAPREVRGMMNLRGQIVTAIDLRRRLGLAERAAGDVPMNVIVRGDDGATSLLVDEIGDVVEVDDGQFERPPETLSGPARAMVRGAYKLKDRLLLTLDTQQAIHVTTP